MSWIYVIVSIVFSVLMLVITKVSFAKIFKSAAEQERETLVNDTNKMLGELGDMISKSDNLASKLQFNTVAIQCNEAESALAVEKEKLKSLEGDLKVAKKKMEEKEILQQELKTSKEEDDKELEELLASYEENSQKSRELEKVLAEQIKVLDDYSKDQSLSSVQRDFFIALNETLEESGSNLRSVITEYEQMFIRLSSLKQQLTDLEVEYSKLIESKISSS